jgi:hypothetical protein
MVYSVYEYNIVERETSCMRVLCDHLSLYTLSLIYKLYSNLLICLRASILPPTSTNTNPIRIRNNKKNRSAETQELHIGTLNHSVFKVYRYR